METQHIVLAFIGILFALIAFYMYWANKKLIESGAYARLEKKAKKKKEKWSMD
jgi:hypothetical protein